MLAPRSGIAGTAKCHGGGGQPRSSPSRFRWHGDIHRVSIVSQTHNLSDVDLLFNRHSIQTLRIAAAPCRVCLQNPLAVSPSRVSAHRSLPEMMEESPSRVIEMSQRNKSAQWDRRIAARALIWYLHTRIRTHVRTRFVKRFSDDLVADSPLHQGPAAAASAGNLPPTFSGWGENSLLRSRREIGWSVASRPPR